MWTRLTVATQEMQTLVDVTGQIQRLVRESGVKVGVCHLFVPHTTAAITVNENCDPDVVRDLLVTLERLVPVQGDYRHGEGNAHAHVKASLLGHQAALPVEGGNLLLGRWQGVFFAEFDGPRRRELLVRVA